MQKEEGTTKDMSERIKNVYENISGVKLKNYDFYNIIGKTTIPKNLTRLDFTRIQEKFNEVFWGSEMSERLSEYFECIKKLEGLTEEEFEKRCSGEIEQSRKLGRNGWIPSQHASPRIIKEWHEWIEISPEKIVSFYEEDNDRVLKRILKKLSKKYVQKPYVTYYQNAIKAFVQEEYMTTAIYLSILFEVRISNLVKFPEKSSDNKHLTYKKKYSAYGYSLHKQEIYKNNANNFMSLRYKILNVFPALEEYTNRLFCFGALPLNLAKEVARPEPDYLDRTWLLHGRCCRETTRLDCIQLINALDVIEYTFEEICQESE